MASQNIDPRVLTSFVYNPKKLSDPSKPEVGCNSVKESLYIKKTNCMSITNKKNDFLRRVAKIPAVKTAIECCSAAYYQVKQCNRLTAAVFSVAETTALYFAVTVKPFLDKVQPYAQFLDQIACHGLDTVEEKALSLMKLLKLRMKVAHCEKSNFTKAQIKSDLPELIPEGKKIHNFSQNTWIFGQNIALGTSGAVYCAADIKKPEDFNYVFKVEPGQNGTLFHEVRCYLKIAEISNLAAWENKKKRHVGISKLHDFGVFMHNNSYYRFLIMDRHSMDLRKLLEKTGGTFPLKTVCLIGLSIIDTLEYIHFHGYVHCDIKAANLLLGREKGTENKIYVVDMDVACKYLNDGVHVSNVVNVNEAVGTPMYMSRDAHRGCFSRRSDLEVVVFNLLHWLTGSLPWSHLRKCKQLQKAKQKYMENIDEFLNILFHGKQCPDGISKLLHYVDELQFEDEPNYDKCRKFLKDDLKSAGFHSDNLSLDFKKVEKVHKKIPSVPCMTSNTSNKENEI